MNIRRVLQVVGAANQIHPSRSEGAEAYTSDPQRIAPALEVQRAVPPPTMNCALVIVMRIEPVAACAAAGIQASTLASANAAATDFMA